MDEREGTKRQEPDRNKRRATSFLRAAATDGGRWPACLALTAGVAAGGWLQPWAICRGRGGAARRHHVSARLIISCLPLASPVFSCAHQTAPHPSLSLSLSPDPPAAPARAQPPHPSDSDLPPHGLAVPPPAPPPQVSAPLPGSFRYLVLFVCVRACVRLCSLHLAGFGPGLIEGSVADLSLRWYGGGLSPAGVAVERSGGQRALPSVPSRSCP